jgi:hypothetical protein
MTKGIRDYVNEKFSELLPQRAEMGNTAFRAAVMGAAVAQYGISVASAATHYNHSLKFVRSVDAELVEGLGRPEDKKGGRKPLVTVTVVKLKTGEVVAAGLSRAKAMELVAASLAKGKAKLGVKEDIEAEAADRLAASEVPAAVEVTAEAVPA